MKLETLMRISGIALVGGYLSAECGPLAVGTGLDTVGRLTQNPEMISSGRETLYLQTNIWIATGGIFFAGCALAEFVGISRLQREIQSFPKRLRQLNNTIF